MRKLIQLCALFLCLCLIPGCAAFRHIGEDSTRVDLPSPEGVAAQPLYGETGKMTYEMITFYTVTEDGLSFETGNRTMAIEYGENRMCRIVESELEHIRASRNPSSIRLLGTEKAGRLLTIDLSAEYYAETDAQLRFATVAALCNTMISMNDVDAVNILVCGRGLAVSGLPFGVQTEEISSITSAFAQMTAEHEYATRDSVETIRRKALIYGTETGKACYVPRLAEIAFSHDNYITELISKTEETLGMQESILLTEPSIVTEDDGSCILELTPKANAFTSASDERIGAFALTMLSFIPDLDSVRFVGLTELTRENLTAALGADVTFCLPLGNGGLERHVEALPLRSAASPLMVLRRLTQLYAEIGFTPALEESDILGVSVDNGVATVNLSASSYRRAQRMESGNERAVVYSVVNTLCDLENIGSVCLLFDGRRVDTLSGNISLCSALMPNPGAGIEKEGKMDDETDNTWE